MKEVIEEKMQNDDETTVKELALLIQSECGLCVSFCTILKGRKLLGWTSRGAAYLKWAQEKFHDDFTDVLWSDETTVQLKMHRRFCCRKNGQGSEAQL